MTKLLKTKLLFLVLTIATNFSVHATKLRWDKDRPIKANIGPKLNRITFEGEAIAEIIGSRGEYEFVSSKCGQIFVTPTTNKTHLDITVITHTGKTQDLSLRITKASSPIIITPESRKPKLKQNHWIKFRQQTVLDLVTELSRMELVPSSELRLFGGATILGKTSNQLNEYYGETYEIKNDTKANILINLKSMRCELEANGKRVIAVGSDEDKIGTNQTAKLWVIYYDQQ